MEPNTIEESIKGLLEAIKESPEYLEFQKQSDILKKKPELKARVDTFRADNYKVQNECETLATAPVKSLFFIAVPTTTTSSNVSVSSDITTLTGWLPIILTSCATYAI